MVYAVMIKLTSVYVDDQDKAIKYYTEVLGFKKKSDFPVGQFKWLTVVSSEGQDDVELLLEPNDNPLALTYQNALFEQGISAAAFEVKDIKGEAERLSKKGVAFTMEPTDAGTSIIAVFDDTCGNLIQIYQIK